MNQDTASSSLPQTGTDNSSQQLQGDITHSQFVDWLRTVAPYIHAFRGKTFVVAFCGELVKAGGLNGLAFDLSLLQALGMRIVIVHGMRPQVEEQLELRKIESCYSHGTRITDDAALECVKEAAGELRLDIEAAFSQGLPNTPMAGAVIRVVSGNFITARPVGILDGINFDHTGIVRKVASDAIRHALDSNAIVLLSPLGFSPTGEAFNLNMEDVAAQAAIALNAEKLIFITESEGVTDEHGVFKAEMSVDAAQRALTAGFLLTDNAFYLKFSIDAIRAGVRRAHIIPFNIDGSVLLELFLHDGVGTMISEEKIESLREADIDDVGAIVQLIEPLENDGTLVRRGRGAVERDIDKFSVIEHDRVLFGCAALYSFPGSDTGELACMTVAPEAQGTGDGEKLLKHIEMRARSAGLKRLFVLTTRTAHWFIKRGFVPASVTDLPDERQKFYSLERKSQVLIKKL
ncbi:amino-acid N-acetyltransferase [Ampullimonas aquatilis]|uniref:amino-acid N-acetyltransferase n=1 Tax=Ampullimonas aquatilis TaxID=1341549 RepID=UPI003C788576